jgi:DNA helicase INO80
VRKKEEREAAEALKREQELREAKRQQQRLNFLIQQTELYSHFMSNKPSSQHSEALPIGDEMTDDQGMDLSTAEAGLDDQEEDPEDAELRKEALKAAQDAVSKQKLLTSAFDIECSKLREAADIEGPINDASVAGSSNIDLQTP